MKEKINMKKFFKILAIISISAICLIFILVLFSVITSCVIKFIINLFKSPSNNFTINPSFTIKNDKFEIFRDILFTMSTLVTILIAAFGFLIYKIIKYRLKIQVENIIQPYIDRCFTSLLVSIGFVYWTDYVEEIKKNKKNNTTKENKKNNIKKNKKINLLKQAIYITEQALTKHAIRLSKQNDTLLICTLKNNLAYYLAEKQNYKTLKEFNDKENALNYIKYLEKNVILFPERKKNWQDTIKFVKDKFER